jgi:flagellar hook-associated protein 2
VGTGSLTLSVGSDSFTLTLDDSNKTLAGIRDAINNASDNTGVTATIINVDDGASGTESRLVLTSNDTGSNNNITVTAINGGEGDLQQLVYDPLPGSGTTNLVERNPAQDAIVLIDNQTVTSNSNILSNAIDGISISLLDADPGTSYTLDVSLNTSSISKAVNNLIENYNSYNETIFSITGYDETGSGALIGDALARSANNQIRQQLTFTVGSISGDFNSLASIGITTNKDGSLSLDSSKLEDAIKNDITSVTNLFTADDGIAKRLDNTLNEYVKSNGIVDSKTQSLNESIDDLTEQREQLAIRLEAFQTRLFDQFIAMDVLIAQLKETGNYLTNALANLPKPNSISK